MPHADNFCSAEGSLASAFSKKRAVHSNVLECLAALTQEADGLCRLAQTHLQVGGQLTPGFCKGCKVAGQKKARTQTTGIGLCDDHTRTKTPSTAGDRHQLSSHLVSQDGASNVAAFEKHQEVDANKLQGNRIRHSQLNDREELQKALFQYQQGQERHASWLPCSAELHKMLT